MSALLFISPAVWHSVSKHGLPDLLCRDVSSLSTESQEVGRCESGAGATEAMMEV